VLEIASLHIESLNYSASLLAAASLALAMITPTPQTNDPDMSLKLVAQFEKLLQQARCSKSELIALRDTLNDWRNSKKTENLREIDIKYSRSRYCQVSTWPPLNVFF
jgi:hypothetical protein